MIRSTAASARLAVAAEFVASRSVGGDVQIVAASRGAADDLARLVARQAGATFGVDRASFTAAAARVAALSGRVPGAEAGAEAVAARAVFDLLGAEELSYFAPVAATPGFPRALARTLHELRLAGVSGADLESGGDGARDLRRLLDRADVLLREASADDRAALLQSAAAAVRDGLAPWAGQAIVLLDVPIDSAAERDFVRALLDASPDALLTIPDGDQRTLDAVHVFGAAVEVVTDDAADGTDLASLRAFVFAQDPPAVRARTGDVCLFSAPGEAREAVEVVRRILDEAERGVPFDEIAVLVRAPFQYIGLLEHACSRGGVPVYFDRGTRRPDPAGRALVALLSCAVEGLSARRFDEYLSLGQVPPVTESVRAAGDGPRDQSRRLEVEVRPNDEVFERPGADAAVDDMRSDDESATDIEVHPDDAVIAGTLRYPWKWEALVVESAVVGGRSRADGRERWRRRLDGLSAEFHCRLEELRRDDPASPRLARLERDVTDLRHLTTFALPLIDQLADWPDEATWGEWLDRFADLADRAVRRPSRLQRMLANLRPMGSVGPVSLSEARDVLRDRLASLDWEPPAHRYGRVFIGTPHQARGRSFRVVFVPGLAERIVPQRPREDPLLLDANRARVGGRLIDQDGRAAAERLLLKIAIGAASERLYVSFPRMDVAETRARVPSFYALDVMRAITGVVPDHRALSADAADAGGASLAWPAPDDPDRAIDDLEHDLAVLRRLLDARPPVPVKGHAHYMLGLNQALRRSVTSRWARGRGAWSRFDGLVRTEPSPFAPLSAHRLANRPYSLSALQRFSACPYQFLLASIHRLAPREEPEPLMRLDPLTKGSLFHRVQAEFYRAMQAAQALPVTTGGVPRAMAVLDEVMARVSAEVADALVPAIPRVWHDEIAELRRDLGIWVQRLADDPTWSPEYFEFSFGLSDAGRDPRSLPDPVTIDGRFILRGSVDLIERDAQRGVLRVTDHKTGKNRSTPDLVVGGGAVLQPVLYGIAIERGLGQPVSAGRLYYCTTDGGFAEHSIDLTDETRQRGLEVLTVIDRAIEQGFLPAAPDDRACTWCDFRAVCGPREEARVAVKPKDRLADLLAVRALR